MLWLLAWLIVAAGIAVAGADCTFPATGSALPRMRTGLGEARVERNGDSGGTH
jgi:hypothetical protein